MARKAAGQVLERGGKHGHLRAAHAYGQPLRQPWGHPTTAGPGSGLRRSSRTCWRTCAEASGSPRSGWRRPARGRRSSEFASEWFEGRRRDLRESTTHAIKWRLTYVLLVL